MVWTRTAIKQSGTARPCAGFGRHPPVQFQPADGERHSVTLNSWILCAVSRATATPQPSASTDRLARMPSRSGELEVAQSTQNCTVRYGPGSMASGCTWLWVVTGGPPRDTLTSSGTCGGASPARPPTATAPQKPVTSSTGFAKPRTSTGGPPSPYSTPAGR